MKSYSSRELIKKIRKKGWYEVDCEGSHHQYEHPIIKGKLTVPHPKKSFPIQTQISILRQAGLK